MNTVQHFDPDRRSKAPLVLIVCLAVLTGATLLASLTQKNFGSVIVSNVSYLNYNGIPLRAKLFKPLSAAKSHPAPGVVYIHGYQNNRETGDAYCIELARRGIVVLEIDAIKALVISGFAYRADASTQAPKNMLMIFGKYDEFRKRMTATRDFEKEWMGIFLHGQLRRPQKSTWWLTFITWSAHNILVIVIPLFVLLVFQYLPLFAIGTIPLVGPGGVFIAFTHNLFHIIGVLIIVLPISTWFYQITGRIYLGAALNAALVTWMFVSSQVVAPIPV